jgi:hypothetical protein
MITNQLYASYLSNQELPVGARFVIHDLIFHSGDSEHRNAPDVRWPSDPMQREQYLYLFQKDGDNVDIGFA